MIYYKTSPGAFFALGSTDQESKLDSRTFAAVTKAECKEPLVLEVPLTDVSST